MLTACAASSQADTALAAPEVVYEVSEEELAEFDTYEDVDGRYQISYPESWFVVGSEDAAGEVYFVNPSLSGEPHKAVVALLIENPSSNIYRFAENAEKEIQRQEGIEDFRLSEEKVVAVNGLPGIERVTHYTLAGQPLAQRTLFLRQTNGTFVLSLTVPDENLANYSSIFDTIIRSFTLV